MSSKARDRGILREIARHIAEIAALPEQQTRINLWKKFNSLISERPMVLVFPEEGWRELIPQLTLQCTDPLLRDWEMRMRKTIYQFEQIHDDQPVTSFFNIDRVLYAGDAGRESRMMPSSSLSQAIKDVQNLKYAEINQEETHRRFVMAQELIGDILPVRVRGNVSKLFEFDNFLVQMRTPEKIKKDMIENPSLYHELMTRLRDHIISSINFYERQGSLSLNSGGDDFVGSGGIGATDELPAADFNGSVRPRDTWMQGDSEYFDQIAPDQFYECVLKYQLPILDKFGLVCYGNRESLETKFDLLIKHVRKLRRLSISQSCDKRIAAEKLNSRYIFSAKINPAEIGGTKVDYEYVKKSIRDTLDAAHGCCVELILKNTPVLHGDKLRITQWSTIASQLAQEHVS